MARRPWLPALSPNAWLRWESVCANLPTSVADVLEVGCGRGGFAVRLAEGARYVGIDSDEVSATVARARLEVFGVPGEIRAVPLSAVAPTEQFDLVCAFEVVEHVEDDASFVRSCAAHLRPGGTLMLTTPADQGRFGAADVMVGHYRRYDVGQMEELLQCAGLEPVRLVRYGAPFAYFLDRVRETIALIRRRGTQRMSVHERTAESGRLLQPGDGLLAAPIWALMFPLRKLQLLLPGRGPSLLALARRPDSSST